jgi:AAA+ ATPase superfamily predicted ATPase
MNLSYLEASVAGFIGRERELRLLTRHLNWVRRGSGDDRGRAILLRGRRRVGKSRLVDIFCGQADVPYAVHQATKGERPDAERARFAASVLRSDLPDRQLLEGVQLDSWDAALRQLAAVLPADAPSIVVIDELPWLLEQDPAAEGTLQTVWDRELSRKPVLLVLIGSDLGMMEALSTYGRPFHQRAAEMVLSPLSPHEVMSMTGLPPADAFDAYLISGGLPLICQEWQQGWSRRDFLAHALDDPTSPLLVSGERVLAAEFPAALQARHVLSAIGTGERTFSKIAARAGGGPAAPLPPGSLSPVLRTLADKRLIAVDTPLSTRPADRDRRYRVADHYLRFWLSFLEEGIPQVERGRGDVVHDCIDRSWTSWRGRAIEPVVRSALSRLLPNREFPGVRVVGGWWNRVNNPEVDLVGADKEAPARQIGFVGSIKWLENNPFGKRELGVLSRDAQAIPGRDDETPLIAVSRSGFATDGLDAAFGPEELIEAWAPPPR